MPQIKIQTLDLLVISAGAFNTIMGFAQSTNPMSNELKAKLMTEVSIAIPQMTFTELDFLRQIETWEDEDEDDFNAKIARHWATLSAEDQEAQLRYWVNEDWDWACEQSNSAIVTIIERTWCKDEL